jgi:hypothetical protein
MSESDDRQLEQVVELFLRMGAEREQAQVMARQLLKRSRQIAAERGISEVEALESLLKQVIEARQGL